MAEYEDDYDDDLYYEDDYLYVEDSFAVADELAETSVPSPPMMDRIEDDAFDGYDHYDYWMDIEYGANELYDVRLPRHDAHQQAGAGLGLKRRAGQAPDASSKKRKLGTGQAQSVNDSPVWYGPNVIYQPYDELYSLDEPCEKCGKLARYSLLPDWRQKLADVLKEQTSNRTLTLGNSPRIEDGAEDGEEDGWEDEDEGDSPLADGDTGPQLDPEMLANVLQAELANSGLEAGDIQKMIVEMLGSGGSMDDILERLTTSVLERVDEDGGDTGVGRWLSDKGVNLAHEHEEMDDAEGDGHTMQEDSATEVNGTHKQGDGQRADEEAGSSILEAAHPAVKKRKAASVMEESAAPTRRGRVTNGAAAVSNKRATRASQKK